MTAYVNKNFKKNWQTLLQNAFKSNALMRKTWLYVVYYAILQAVSLLLEICVCICICATSLSTARGKKLYLQSE